MNEDAYVFRFGIKPAQVDPTSQEWFAKMIRQQLQAILGVAVLYCGDHIIQPDKFALLGEEDTIHAIWVE